MRIWTVPGMKRNRSKDYPLYEIPPIMRRPLETGPWVCDWYDEPHKFCGGPNKRPAGQKERNPDATA